jgi:aromatic ring hydroxylase
VNIYHEYDILNSISGGLPSTIPYEEDWLNPETGPDLAKYISRKPGVSSEKLHRLYRFISDLSCSAMEQKWSGLRWKVMESFARLRVSPSALPS